MPMTCWENLSFKERKELEELALIMGIPLSEENLWKIYKDCRECATGSATQSDEKEAKREVWRSINDS